LICINARKSVVPKNGVAANTAVRARLKEKEMRYNFALALPVVTALLATAPFAQAQTQAPAQDQIQAEEGFAAALGCTRARATAVALKATHGGRVVFVIFDRETPPPHWEVDILDPPLEHEVWVNIRCKVIRILSQPID
jgi:hypothetical protein